MISAPVLRKQGAFTEFESAVGVCAVQRTAHTFLYILGAMWHEDLQGVFFLE